MPRLFGRAGIGLAAVAMLTTSCTSSGSTGAPPAPYTQGTTSRPSSSDAVTTKDVLADPPGVGTWRRYWVGSVFKTFIEPAYTASDGTTIAARRLLVKITYPLAGRPSKTARPAKGPFPMIVFAPGFMQCDAPYSALLKFWATAGYVIAAVNFPYSDCLAASPTENDMNNQPRDMSYVITRMLKLSRASHGRFSRLLNPKQIGIAGQSDGGDTVAAVAANTCCTDRRVRAVAVESGSEWGPMRGLYFTGRFTLHPVPILFSQGSADTVNLPGCSVNLYDLDHAKPNFYLDLYGASHTGPYWGVNRYEQIVAKVSLAFFNRYLLRHANAGTVMHQQGNVSGLSALFRDRQGQLPPAIPAHPCY